MRLSCSLFEVSPMHLYRNFGTLVWLVAVTLLPITDSRHVAASAAQEDELAVVIFERDIAPLFKSRCQSCHNSEAPKGGLDIFDRDSVLGYIEPNEPESSSIWTDYLLQHPVSSDPDSMVMPPDGPLAPSELALLKVWIAEGAVWPEADNAVGELLPGGGALTADASLGVKVYRASGYFHPAIVHFPIALIVLSGGCAFLSYFLGSRCESMAFHTLWIGALSSVIACFMGWSFAEMRGFADWSTFPSDTASSEQVGVFWHRWLGVSVTVWSLLLVAIGLFASKWRSNGLRNAWRMGAILAALMVCWVGHQGGELVYGDVFTKAYELITS